MTAPALEVSDIAVHQAYTRWSTQYDRVHNTTRDLDALATRQILGNRRFARTIEAGCGSGKNTPFFASVSDEVLALDFSHGMLDIARARSTALNVQFHQADLTHPWPCATGAAALVSFNLVLEHISDLRPVFAEAAHALVGGGWLFVSELHPCRQYLGSQARFVDSDNNTVKISAWTHHISDFLDAAGDAGLRLEQLKEWWHQEDTSGTPRLVTFGFRKGD